MERVAGALSFQRATLDLQRVTRDLDELQRQTASGRRAEDLKGYQGAAGLVVSARSAIASAEARVEAADLLTARLETQDVALTHAHDAAQRFVTELTDAAARGDGRGLKNLFDRTLQDVSSALNTRWNGHYVFGGDRTDAPPVQVSSRADILSGVPRFAASERTQLVDLGEGQTYVAADRVVDIADGLFDALEELAGLIGASGDAMGVELSAAQRDQILAVAATAERGRSEMSQATARNGESQRMIEEAKERLTRRTDLLTRSLGERVDVDLAEVAVALSQKQTQYEAIASMISQLRDLSLVNYLR